MKDKKDKPAEVLVKQMLTEYLEKNGFRKTPERYVILEEIYNYPGHFEIEKLYIAMRNKNVSISRATLYNTIELLLGAKLIVKHQFGGNVKNYERVLVNSQHDHLICIVCGKVLEFADSRIEEVRSDIAAKNNFNVSHHTLYIYGTCDECRHKAKPRIEQ